ncbi:HAD family hydrolase [Paenibacillus sinopodophylli]|uniref:HAD family hydrolase n=1 Tax=Paenibacillus sinopodophylli TaxID=1837342 RepID=UPI00110C9010|nr:HAD family hydrolase [Paenibacillus sinopodophylli]
MAIKAVLFDLDGTLLDRDTSLLSFVSAQYERFPELLAARKEDYVKRFIELDNHGYVWKDRVYQQLIEEFSIVGLAWTELLQDYLHVFQEYCLAFPHASSMLAELKSRGLKLALVSNGYGQFQYDNFKALGIAPLFDEVLISEWEGLRKPDPAIFVRALSKLEVHAKEAIFVGDHLQNDVQASQMVGMKAIWKRNISSSSASDADAVIEGLDELTDIILSFEM